MQSETGFPCGHQLKSYVAFKSRLKLAARAVLSADAGLLVEIFPPHHLQWQLANILKLGHNIYICSRQIFGRLCKMVRPVL